MLTRRGRHRENGGAPAGESMPAFSEFAMNFMMTDVPAMVLAAGRGERMRPLTDSCPKPLLKVQGQPLLHWHLQALARACVSRVVINTAWLAQAIVDQVGDHFPRQAGPVGNTHTESSAPLAVTYSHEGRDFGGALETAGGICRALPLLCPSPAAADVFWVLAGDVFVPGFDFAPQAVQRFAASSALAHLWLVPNPAHNPRGDFGLDAASGLALNLPPGDSRPRWTYATIGLYRGALFAPPWCAVPAGNPLGVKAALAPLLRAAMDRGRVSAELYTGPWTDVGTPQRLTELNAGFA